MKYLVVNADDFGYTPGVNQGIIRAHREGVVTSTSLMVDGKAAMEAVEMAKQYPDLALGLHFQMTGESVVGLAGALMKFAVSPRSSLEDDFNRQVEKFHQMVGRLPSHLDSHHHIHLHSKFKDVLSEFGRTYNVPVRGLHGNRLITRFYAKNQLRLKDLHRVSYDCLQDILLNLDEGVSELMCHPALADELLVKTSAYSREREYELATLVDPRVQSLQGLMGFRLISWSSVNDPALAEVSPL